MKKGQKIFLAHASEDKAVVRSIYSRLQKEGHTPWLDEFDIEGGQVWKRAIEDSMRECDIFVACLSEFAVNKTGYLFKELRVALDIYSEKPAGQKYIIPLRLDECEIPDLRFLDYSERLRDIQSVDYWKPDGMQRLLNAIESPSRAGNRGALRRSRRFGVQHSSYEFKAAKPLTFLRGEKATNLLELLDLCEKCRTEARDYLFDGYFERWLEHDCGEIAVAKAAVNIRKEYAKAIDKGLEYFVRHLRKRVGKPPDPILLFSPEKVNLGTGHVGFVSNQVIRVSEANNRYVWGSISLKSGVNGLSVTNAFSSTDSVVTINLDSVWLTPGPYQAEVLFSIEGTLKCWVVPLYFNVLPITIKEVPSLHRGELLYDTVDVSRVRLACTEPGGILRGDVNLERADSGITLKKFDDRSGFSIDVTINTASYQPGHRYSNKIILHTNAGIYRMPLSFTVIPLKPAAYLSGRDKVQELHLGQIPYERTRSVSLQIRNEQYGGILKARGDASLQESYSSDVSLKTAQQGSHVDVSVHVDTSNLEAGQSYTRTIRVDTNGGRVLVPVRFSVERSIQPVVFATLWGVFAGALLGLVRFMVEEADVHSSGYLLEYSDFEGPFFGIFFLIAFIVWAAIVAVPLYLTLKK